jgi:hypothetical protein
MKNNYEEVEDLLTITRKLAEDIDDLITEIELEGGNVRHLDSAWDNVEEVIHYLKKYLEGS